MLQAELPTRLPYDRTKRGRMDGADNGLVPLSVAEWGAFVFVAHCPQQPSLKAWLGRGGQAMLPRIAAALHRPVHTHTYHIQCNWKVPAFTPLNPTPAAGHDEVLRDRSTSA